MMRRKRLILRCAVAVLAAAVMLAAGAANALMIGLEPSSTTAAPGDTVSFDLVISGLTAGGPDSLGDFDLDIMFDATALSLTSFSLGSSLGDITLGEAFDFSLGDLGGGIVNLAEVSLLEADAGSCVFCLSPFLDDIQLDSFVLATLNFNVDVLAPGSTTTVSIDQVFALGDGFGQPLALDGVSAATISSPIAGAVPEPSAAVVFAVGAVVVGQTIRRRHRA